jgi:uncharacterized membrane protein
VIIRKGQGEGIMSVNTDALAGEQVSKQNSGVNVGEIERLVSALAGGALAVYGLRQRTPGGLCLTLAGTALLHRGVTGHCNTYQLLGVTTNKHAATSDEAPVARDVHVEKAIVIDKSPEELFSFWRRFENLPRFMKHLKSVTCTGLNGSHWIAEGPGGKDVEWDAEIYNEKPNELIAWRSLEGSDVVNAGTVRFKPLGVRGTEVRVVLNYNVPGGKLSAMLAKLFGREPGQMVADDLRRLKQILETGEAATTEGQPSGRDPNARPARLDESKVRKEAQPALKSRTATSHG